MDDFNAHMRLKEEQRLRREERMARREQRKAQIREVNMRRSVHEMNQRKVKQKRRRERRNARLAKRELQLLLNTVLSAVEEDDALRRKHESQESERLPHDLLGLYAELCAHRMRFDQRTQEVGDHPDEDSEMIDHGTDDDGASSPPWWTPLIHVWRHGHRRR